MTVLVVKITTATIKIIITIFNSNINNHNIGNNNYYIRNNTSTTTNNNNNNNNNNNYSIRIKWNVLK